MLMWIEDHLIVLGLLAIVSGIGLGGLLTWTERHAGRIVASPGARPRRRHRRAARAGAAPPGRAA
jgi:uncharacterized iron-regulated membrane protein